MSTCQKPRILALASCALLMSFTSAAYAGGSNRISAIDHLEVNGATNVLVRGTRTPTFTVYKLQRPARVIVDIAQAKLAPKLMRDGKVLRQVNTWAVSQVRAHTMYRATGSIVRVTVTMARPGMYNVKAVGHSVRVTVTPRDRAPRRANVAGANAATKSARAATKSANAETKSARAATKSARAEAARAKRELALMTEATAKVNASARAEAARAKRELALMTEATAKVNASARDADVRARSARRNAQQARLTMARARTEALRARKVIAALSAEKTKVNRSARQARADRDRARSALAKAKAETRRAKRNLARAMKERASATRQAAEARAEARRESQRAARIQVDSRRAVAMAKAAAVAARKNARKSKRDATRRLRKAAIMMKQARVELRRTKAMQTRAKSAQRTARLANTRAGKRELAAKKARLLASARRAEADRASSAARRYRVEASRAVNRREATALTARANKAAADAQRRMKRANKAAKVAERRRREAESATRTAERRRRGAITALTAAMRQRELAERAKRLALARKTSAIEQRRSAEARRKRAESAATEAQSRARRARVLRDKEERSLRKTVVARKNADRRRTAAVHAHSKIAASLRAVRRTKQLVAKLGRQTRAASKRKHSRRVARLQKERRIALSDLASQRHKLDRQRHAAKQLDSRRKTAFAELARLRMASAKVRVERKRQETLLAQLSQRRATQERRLREVRTAILASRKAAKRTSVRSRIKLKRVKALRARVRNVDFVDRRNSARVVIALSSPARPKIIRSTRRHAILEIANATIAQKLERTLDTTKFKGPVRSVSSYRNPRDPTKVRVVVELNNPARSTLKRVGNTYHWEFAKSRRHRRRRVAAKRRSTLRNLPSPVVSGFGATATPIRNSTVSQVRNRRRRRIYRGRKVDLDFKDVDIHDLLRSLARAGDIDFVIPDGIKEKVTIKLTRVPWDQALEVILESKGLWYRRDGRIYRIAKRDDLAAEDKAEADRLRALANRESPEPEVFPLNYADAEQVKKQLEPLLSPKGRIEVNKRTNSLIINDIAANRRRITQLVTRLDTQTPQIQIEARIIEARSTYIREIGIQWGGNANASPSGGNATGLIFPNVVSATGGAEDAQTPTGGVSAIPSNFAVNLPAAVGTGAGGALGLALGSVGGNLNLSLRLSALEDQGSVRIISAPKITVINNVEATISQGVSIPISVISANGVQTQFVPADLQLKVKPKVSNDCFISLDLEITKNEADFVNTGARGDPTILRKEAKTTLLVADGETTVLGGIYTRNTGVSYSKIPFFGDLPVVGWFFRKRRENDERTEVLVFITPKITNKALFSASRCK